MTDLPRHPIVFASLRGRRPTQAELRPSPDQMQAIAADLGLTALRKLHMQVTLAPIGSADWRLSGHLGATVVQDCAITLAPVTTRIEEEISRQYLADWQHPEGAEVEMTADVEADPLPETLDLYEVALEALRLAVPAFVRAPGAELGSLTHAAEGVTPLSDADTKPFAGLADLKSKLQNPPQGED